MTPRKITAVADPDRVGLGAELLADLDALQVVLDGLLAHGVIGVRQASELVREFLSGMILKRVGVHGVEAQAQ